MTKAEMSKSQARTKR